MLLLALSLLAAPLFPGALPPDPHPSASVGAPAITLTGADGKTVALETEDTGGIKDRPLVKSKKRLDKQYGHEFLFLDKVEATPGETLTATCEIAGGPLRLTIYEIAKDDGAERTLRVIGTKWYPDGALAQFTTTVAKHAEDVFLVTAEKTTDPAQLDKHLQYMETQGDELLVKGFGTNWDLSKLEFKLAEKKSDGTFSKDADWLVGNLDDPQWVASIRVVAPGS